MMRVSIWQQWASNHSSWFSLVGKFATAQDAQRAGQEVRRIIRRFAELEHEHQWEYYPYLSEEEFAQLKTLLGLGYEITYKYSYHYLPEWATANEVELHFFVTVIDEHVFLCDRGYSGDGNGPGPFASILLNLGAEVLDDTYSRVSITCRAPDEETAQAIHETAGTYITFKSLSRKDLQTLPQIRMRPPWAAIPDEPLFEKAELNELLRLRHQITAARGKLARGKEPLSATEDALLRRFDLYDPDAPALEVLYVSDVDLDWTWIDSRDMSLERNGPELHFRDLVFFNPGQGLQTLIGWLKSKGCTDITYSYRGTSINES
jgi:hypothetical protein